jgi:hypothetical protein
LHGAVEALLQAQKTLAGGVTHARLIPERRALAKRGVAPQVERICRGAG